MKAGTLQNCWKSGWTVAGVAWIVLYFGAEILLRKMNIEAAPAIRIVIAAIPILPATLFLVYFIRDIGRLDELQRQIHLEALAFAFPLTVLLLMTLGLVQSAVALSPDDWSYRHVWLYPPIFYFVGLTIASRRYE